MYVTITKSDGTPYRLRGPNPIMQGQELWDEIITHNLDQHQEFVYKPKSWKFREKTEEVILEPSAPTKPIFNLEDTGKLKCWVLPAEIKTFKDDLYGQETRRIVWGNKFSTEVRVEEITDLFSTFWTNGIKEILKGSILFVDMRHWKVESTSFSENGILIKCVASDQTPSFA